MDKATLTEAVKLLGRKGGRTTAQRRSPEERSQSARKAVLARWARTRAGKLRDRVPA